MDAPLRRFLFLLASALQGHGSKPGDALRDPAVLEAADAYFRASVLQ
jgi:hypothetical protein